LNSEIKKDQTGGAFSTLWRNVKGMRNVKKNMMGRDHLEDPGEGGRIILKWVLKK
jgi:hypothetical protein